MRTSKFKIQNSKFSKGFTLIELLVVIAIIGILSSVVLASLTSAKQKAQLAVLKSTDAQIRTALDAYYASHGCYPVSSNPATPCNGSSASYCIASTDCTVAVTSGTISFGEKYDKMIASAVDKQNKNISNPFGISMAYALDVPDFEFPMNGNFPTYGTNKGFAYSVGENGASVSITGVTPGGVYVKSVSTSNPTWTCANSNSGSGCEAISGSGGSGGSGGTCGPSNNQACSGYCNTDTNASNYDADGTGSCSYGSGYNCGSSNNQACTGYCTNTSASNYDTDGTGACNDIEYSCGSSNNQTCSNYCSTNTNASNYDADGTGTCNYGGSCTGTPTLSCSTQDQSGCQGTGYNLVCSWSGEACSGSYSTNESCSTYNSNSSTCQMTNGCSYPGNAGNCSSFGDAQSCSPSGCSPLYSYCSWNSSDPDNQYCEGNSVCAGIESWNCSSTQYFSNCSGSYDDGSCTGTYTKSNDCSGVSTSSCGSGSYASCSLGGGSCSSNGVSCSSLSESNCASVPGCTYN